MNKRIIWNLLIVVSALASIEGSAHAQTWATLPMPYATVIGTEQLNSTQPFALGVPATIDSRKYRSDMQSSIKGVRIRGSAIAIGSGSGGAIGPNHEAVFYTSTLNYNGTEYGFVMYLPEGWLRFYQSINTNLQIQQWADMPVWYTPSDHYLYELDVNSDGSFDVKVVSVWPPYPVIATTHIDKQPWMPNVYNASGYFVITAKHNQNDGIDWSKSALHVDSIEVSH